jgi:hypothetical protein
MSRAAKNFRLTDVTRDARALTTDLPIKVHSSWRVIGLVLRLIQPHLS